MRGLSQDGSRKMAGSGEFLWTAVSAMMQGKEYGMFSDSGKTRSPFMVSPVA